MYVQLKRDQYQLSINKRHLNGQQSSVQMNKYYPHQLNIESYELEQVVKRRYPKSCERVMEYLTKIKQIYDTTRKMSRLDLYMYFCELEKNYVSHVASKHEQNKQHGHITYDLEDDSVNYCHSVHKTYSNIYDNDNRTVNCHFSAASIFNCCSCKKPMTPNQSYDIQLLNKSTKCYKCYHVITRECLCVRATIKKYNKNKYFVVNECDESRHFPNVISVNVDSWTEFCHEIVIHMKEKFTLDTKAELQYIINKINGNFSCFGLDLIEAMYKQLHFVNKICTDYSYWNSEKVLDQSIHRYFKFLKLLSIHKYKENASFMFVPTMDINLVWCAHMNNYSKYVLYSMKISNNIIYRDDSLNNEKLRLGYAKTYILWRKEYGSSYSTVKPKYKDWNTESFYENLFSFSSLFNWMKKRNQWKKYSKPLEINLYDPMQNGKGIGIPINDVHYYKNTNFRESLYPALTNILSDTIIEN